MKIDTNEENDCIVRFNISFELDEVKEERERIYGKISQTANVAGFRKGKVPRSILETKFSKKIEDDTIEKLIPRGIQQAIKDSGYTPLASFKIENFTYNHDEGISYQAAGEVMPKIELSEYRGICLKKKIIKITDADVENCLHKLQERDVELVVVEGRKVKNGDLVIINFESFIDNKPIENGKMENFLLEIGDDYFISGFDRQIIGMKKNEEKKFSIRTPKNFNNPEIVNKKVHFKVKVVEIKEKLYPPLDDEFAKSLEGSFESLNHLRNALYEELMDAAKIKADQDIHNQLLDAVLLLAMFSLPQTIINREIEYLILNLEYHLKKVGKNLSDYLKEHSILKEELIQQLKPEAIGRINRGFILDAIAEKEKIPHPEPDEIREILSRHFCGDQQKVDEYIKNKGKITSLMDEVRIQKTIDFLLSVARIEEVIE